MPDILSFSTLDVFTSIPFKGNQLAVVHLPSSTVLDQNTKQIVAREFNLSETIFLHDAANGSSERRVDIFTTTEELPFAGHPIIGIIWHICQNSSPQLEDLTLLTKAGPIKGRFDRVLNMATAEIPHKVRLHAKGVTRQAVLASQAFVSNNVKVGPDFPLVSIVKGLSFVLAELPSETPALQNLRADCQTLDRDAVLPDEGWAPSFTATYFYAIVSRGANISVRARMLEPSIGEDAGTGSAASALGAYLALQDGKPGQTYSLAIEQGVDMGRESNINVRVTLDASGQGVEEIVLAGQAALVMQGTMVVPGQ